MLYAMLSIGIKDKKFCIAVHDEFMNLLSSRGSLACEQFVAVILNTPTQH